MKIARKVHHVRLSLRTARALLCALLVACAGAQVSAPPATTPTPEGPSDAPAAPEEASAEVSHSPESQRPEPVDVESVLCTGPHCRLDFPSVEANDRRVRVHPCPGICEPNDGVLTDEGVRRLRDLHAQLAGEELLPKYGCPGCADGPSARFDVSRAGTVQEHWHDPRRPQASPATLRAASDVLEGLRRAVTDCKATKLVAIEPTCTVRSRP